MKTPRRAALAVIVLGLSLACGSARAQLLPGGFPGLPPVGRSFPSQTSIPPAPRLPRASPTVKTPAPLPSPPRLPDLAAPSATGIASSALDASGDLAQRANEALGLAGDMAGGAVTAVAAAAAPYGEQARALLRRHPDVLEADDQGRPTVRGELLGLGVSAAALDRALAAGFTVRSREAIDGLDLAMVVLAPPRRMSGRDAVKRLRALDPAGRYDFNHVYVESGGAGATVAAIGGVAPSAKGARIGLVDGSALASHPALRTAPLTQQAFAPGGARVTAHGTAVASLLVGSAPGFRGAAPGAALYVADVYGTTAAGGSALAVARGLGWLARSGTPVVNISLVGPPNALLEAAVAALVARGCLVVAAVGNDGPAAGPLYPAAYPGVVAVTAVDPRRRPLPEAGRGGYVAFAAPGSEMMAAGLDGGFATVRGASFAAPLVAGRLARQMSAPDPAAAARALAALSGEAVDLGKPGRDPVFGRGLVAADLAVRPASLDARR